MAGPNFNIVSLEDGNRATLTFADGAPIVTEGYGGWQVISRPREVGVVEWQGRSPMAIEIPFMIDYWFDEHRYPKNLGELCENQIKSLERLAGIGSHKQPPVCRVNSGGVIPHDYSINPSIQWVIESLTWDRSVELRRENGRRLRAGGSLVIRQFLTARDILHKIKANNRARIPSTYRVRRGDTLSKIAKKLYGDSHKWKIIADANHIRDRRHLKINQILKIPRT
jgi:hypothetical protein